MISAILSSFIKGCAMGLGAAIPLGPINVMMMSIALRSYPNAVAFGMGAISADVTYLSLVLFGFFHFLNNPTLQYILGFGGAMILLYLSWLIWQGRNEPIHTTKIQKRSLLANYLKGYSLTLLNPYTLIFWFSVSTYITTTDVNAPAMVAGVIVSIMCWVTLMPLAVHKSKHLLSQNMATKFTIASVIILLFFALGLLWRLITA